MTEWFMTQASRSLLSSNSAHRHGHAAVRLSAVTELAAFIASPTPNRAGFQNCAGAPLAAGNCDGIGDTRNLDGHNTVHRIAVAELSAAVAAPALNLSIT